MSCVPSYRTRGLQSQRNKPKWSPHTSTFLLPSGCFSLQHSLPKSLMPASCNMQVCPSVCLPKGKACCWCTCLSVLGEGFKGRSLQGGFGRQNWDLRPEVSTYMVSAGQSGTHKGTGEVRVRCRTPHLPFVPGSCGAGGAEPIYILKIKIPL